MKTHGLNNTSEYRTWCSIKQRCYNKNNIHYKNYGGRGIIMCDEWKNSPEIFFKDMGLKPTLKHTIERRDNNKGYFKDNCYWATRKEQQNNRRANVILLYKGMNKNLTEWCKILNLSYKMIEARIRRNWTVEKAFETPCKIKTKKLNENKVREIKKLLKQGLMYAEIAKIYDIDQTMVGSIMRGKSWKNVI